MKRIAIASVLALGLAAASFTARAAGGAGSDDLDSAASEIPTVRVTSHVDDTCHVWVEGRLRATIGPFGRTGFLPVVPFVPERTTDVFVRCEGGRTYHGFVENDYEHCEFSIAPRPGYKMIARCY